MKWWIVILVLGVAFCGWVFLKARELEPKNTLKKIKAGHKSIRKAARKATGDIGEPKIQHPAIDRASLPVRFSGDKSSELARIKTIEELMQSEERGQK